MKDSNKLARQFISEQADALTALGKLIGEPFGAAIQIILESKAQMILTGIGKSGLIARKAAATLSSTGTPAIFMHPVEGVHGDLGLVDPNAVLLALSKSGHTDELVSFVGHFRRVGGRVIVVAEEGNSPLAELADVVLAIPKRPEAGPLALAPTTSTLMMLALCDALAMSLLDARGFDEAQFARFHPDGSLGKRLLLRAGDLMHSGDDLPKVSAAASFKDLLVEMTGKHLGMSCIVDERGGLVGVFTDGDLRRLLTRSEAVTRLSAGEAWRLSRRDPNEPPVRCSTVPTSMLAVDCLRLMRESEITMLIVSEDGAQAEGVVRLQDLVRAGLG
ncbi:MAG TPA: KpsF/GutQ family sugar-phosphate isomerase [Phycisphaerae bacterium]|nr:KpsF/GutQ family sugar-phosphate isomerase [Phycisphaerae bacterium]